uniref:PP1192R n=1 Tax=African swine fever virus TaxID=10497 RepID=A0A6G7KU68_ASF
MQSAISKSMRRKKACGLAPSTKSLFRVLWGSLPKMWTLWHYLFTETTAPLCYKFLSRSSYMPRIMQELAIPKQKRYPTSKFRLLQVCFLAKTMARESPLQNMCRPVLSPSGMCMFPRWLHATFYPERTSIWPRTVSRGEPTASGCSSPWCIRSGPFLPPPTARKSMFNISTSAYISLCLLPLHPLRKCLHVSSSCPYTRNYGTRSLCLQRSKQIFPPGFTFAPANARPTWEKALPFITMQSLAARALCWRWPKCTPYCARLLARYIRRLLWPTQSPIPCTLCRLRRSCPPSLQNLYTCPLSTGYIAYKENMSPFCKRLLLQYSLQNFNRRLQIQTAKQHYETAVQTSLSLYWVPFQEYNGPASGRMYLPSQKMFLQRITPFLLLFYQACQSLSWIFFCNPFLQKISIYRSTYTNIRVLAMREEKGRRTACYSRRKEIPRFPCCARDCPWESPTQAGPPLSSAACSPWEESSCMPAKRCQTLQRTLEKPSWCATNSLPILQCCRESCRYYVYTSTAITKRRKSEQSCDMAALLRALFKIWMGVEKFLDCCWPTFTCFGLSLLSMVSYNDCLPRCYVCMQRARPCPWNFTMYRSLLPGQKSRPVYPTIPYNITRDWRRMSPMQYKACSNILSTWCTRLPYMSQQRSCFIFILVGSRSCEKESFAPAWCRSPKPRRSPFILSDEFLAACICRYIPRLTSWMPSSGRFPTSYTGCRGRGAKFYPGGCNASPLSTVYERFFSSGATLRITCFITMATCRYTQVLYKPPSITRAPPTSIQYSYAYEASAPGTWEERMQDPQDTSVCSLRLYLLQQCSPRRTHGFSPTSLWTASGQNQSTTCLCCRLLLWSTAPTHRRAGSTPLGPANWKTFWPWCGPTSIRTTQNTSYCTMQYNIRLLYSRCGPPITISRAICSGLANTTTATARTCSQSSEIYLLLRSFLCVFLRLLISKAYKNRVSACPLLQKSSTTVLQKPLRFYCNYSQILSTVSWKNLCAQRSKIPYKIFCACAIVYIRIYTLYNLQVVLLCLSRIMQFCMRGYLTGVCFTKSVLCASTRCLYCALSWKLLLYATSMCLQSYIFPIMWMQRRQAAFYASMDSLRCTRRCSFPLCLLLYRNSTKKRCRAVILIYYLCRLENCLSRPKLVGWKKYKKCRLVLLWLCSFCRSHPFPAPAYGWRKLLRWKRLLYKEEILSGNFI